MKRTQLKAKRGFKRMSFEEAKLKLKRPPQRAKNRSKLKVKKSSVAKLKKKADSVFSQYIRIRDNGKCYTCGLQKHWKEMQNGHFVPRQYLSLRYDEKNCNCQCYACNMLYNGQPSAYAKHLKEDYGDHIIETLESKRKDITQWRENEYNLIIDKYTALVLDMLSKKDII